MGLFESCREALIFKSASEKNAWNPYNAADARPINIPQILGEGVPIWGGHWWCQVSSYGSCIQCVTILQRLCIYSGCSGAGTCRSAVPANIFEPERRSGKYCLSQQER